MHETRKTDTCVAMLGLCLLAIAVVHVRVIFQPQDFTILRRAYLSVAVPPPASLPDGVGIVSLEPPTQDASSALPARWRHPRPPPSRR